MTLRAGVLQRIIVVRGMLLAMICVLIGVAGSSLTRLTGSLLPKWKPSGPIPFGVVAIVLIAVALFACYVPARRASRVDSMVALRYE